MIQIFQILNNHVKRCMRLLLIIQVEQAFLWPTGTYYFFFLEYSFPDTHTNCILTFFRSLLKCHLSEAVSYCPIQNQNPSPALFIFFTFILINNSYFRSTVIVLHSYTIIHYWSNYQPQSYNEIRICASCFTGLAQWLSVDS